MECTKCHGIVHFKVIDLSAGGVAQRVGEPSPALKRRGFSAPGRGLRQAAHRCFSLTSPFVFLSLSPTSVLKAMEKSPPVKIKNEREREIL